MSEILIKEGYSALVYDEDASYIYVMSPKFKETSKYILGDSNLSESHRKAKARCKVQWNARRINKSNDADYELDSFGSTSEAIKYIADSYYNEQAEQNVSYSVNCNVKVACEPAQSFNTNTIKPMKKNAIVDSQLKAYFGDDAKIQWLAELSNKLTTNATNLESLASFASELAAKLKDVNAWIHAQADVENADWVKRLADIWAKVLKTLDDNDTTKAVIISAGKVVDMNTESFDAEEFLGLK